MAHASKSPEAYRIVLQQDAPEPMLRAPVRTISPEALLDYSIRQFAHLPIDVYASDANHGGGVYYRSKVAESMCSFPSSYRAKDHVRMDERLKALFAAGTDPLEVYCRGAHEAGIDYMIRLRMNDLHDVVGLKMKLTEPNRSPKQRRGEPYYYTSKFKSDHPQYLLGDPSDDTPPDTYPYWQRSALNYALGPVRRFIGQIAEELINGYDLDAFEMDFIRFTFYFRQAEAYAQRHVLTQLVRRIRKMCDEAGKRRGRPIRLSARVPDTLELGLRAGIDVPQWLRDGLLDLVVIGGGYTQFGTPWAEIADEARRAGVPALACLNMVRGDLEQTYAAAHRAHCAGVTGFKLWNFWYCMDYYHPEGENPCDLSFTRDLVKPERLAEKPLRYVCDWIRDPADLVGSAHFHHSWPGQMPLTIGVAEDGIGQVITFDIPAPVLEARRGQHEAQLQLDLDNFWAPDDKLELYLNDRRLEQVKFELRPKQGAEPYRVTCTVSCDRLVAGDNRVELRLLEHSQRVDPFIGLMGAQLTLPGARNED